jgi:hypothetical protein
MPRTPFTPLPAADTYQLLTVDKLKVLAKYVTHAAPAKKTELVDLLTRTMLDDANLREFYEEQDELGQAAIREATHHPEGKLDLPRFEAKYGQPPRLTAKKDRKPDDDYDYSTKPAKLALFFPHFDAIPTDVRDRLRAFVPPPEALTTKTAKDLPAKVKPVWLLQTGYWAKEEVREQTPYIRHTAAVAQQEVKTLLRLIENSQLKVSDKTHRPSQSALNAIAEVLTEGDYYQPENEIDYEHDPGADLAMKPFAWSMIVQAAGWASVSGGKLRLTDAGRKALSHPAAELLWHAWEKWLKTTLLDEFSRINIIKGQTSGDGDALTAVAPRRTVIDKALRKSAAGEWIAIDDFFRQVKLAPAPGLVLSEDPWRLYLFEQQYGAFGFGAAFPFEALEGRYIMALLFEYVATMGLIDIAYIPPSGARNEFRDRWGADDLSCLSRYDGLLYFRINPLGAWILGLAPEYVPEKVAEEKLLKVLPNHDLVAELELPPGDALFLDRFAARVSTSVWHLEAEKILAAVAQGRTVAELADYLRAKSSVGVPETVEVFLKDLAQRATLLCDRGSARLIECADAHTAALLASDRKLKGMVKLAGETWLVFAAKDENAVRRGLKELGYVLPPP